MAVCWGDHNPVVSELQQEVRRGHGAVEKLDTPPSGALATAVALDGFCQRAALRGDAEMKRSPRKLDLKANGQLSLHFTLWIYGPGGVWDVPRHFLEEGKAPKIACEERYDDYNVTSINISVLIALNIHSISMALRRAKVFSSPASLKPPSISASFSQNIERVVACRQRHLGYVGR
jgi:hypothetical protein